MFFKIKILFLFIINTKHVRVKFTSRYYLSTTFDDGRCLKIHGFWRKLTFFAAVFILWIRTQLIDGF